MSADEVIHPALAEAQHWAELHLDLLRRTFERFDEYVEWPHLEDLQHDFTVAGREEVEVAALAYEMPNSLGFVEQGRLVLRVRGLSYVVSASKVLDAWAEAIQLACQRWVQDHKTAWLRREDVEEITHRDRHLSDLVSILLFRERWPFGDGRGNPTDDDWSQKVIETVRIARSIRDPMVLLEKRAAVEFPPTAQIPMPVLSELEVESEPAIGPSEGKGPGFDVDETEDLLRSTGLRLRDVLLNPYVVVIVGGVVVLVVWAVLSNGFHEIFHRGEGSTVATTTENRQRAGGEAQPKENASSLSEEAGEDGASTFANPFTLSEPGERVEPGQSVRVTCRIYSPQPPSVTPDGYWYRLTSSPWNGRYYAPANSFWNGDVPGHPPYTHNTDTRVPICKSGIPKKPQA